MFTATHHRHIKALTALAARAALAGLAQLFVFVEAPSVRPRVVFKAVLQWEAEGFAETTETRMERAHSDSATSPA